MKKASKPLDIAGKANLPLAIALRELISNAGELAKYLNCSVQAVNQYKQGISTPQLDKLVKIADFYNVSLDYLTGRAKEASPDVSIQGAVKTTGLSEDSINILKAAVSASGYEGIADPNKNRVGVLDLLIKDPNFFMFLLSDIYMCYENYCNYKRAEEKHKELKANTKSFSVLPESEDEFQQAENIAEAFDLKNNMQEKYEVAVFKANRRFGAILENLISKQFKKNETKENRDG